MLSGVITGGKRWYECVMITEKYIFISFICISAMKSCHEYYMFYHIIHLSFFSCIYKHTQSYRVNITVYA